MGPHHVPDSALQWVHTCSSCGGSGVLRRAPAPRTTTPSMQTSALAPRSSRSSSWSSTRISMAAAQACEQGQCERRGAPGRGRSDLGGSRRQELRTPLLLLAAALLVHSAAAVKVVLPPGQSECISERVGEEHFTVRGGASGTRNPGSMKQDQAAALQRPGAPLKAPHAGSCRGPCRPLRDTRARPPARDPAGTPPSLHSQNATARMLGFASHDARRWHSRAGAGAGRAPHRRARAHQGKQRLLRALHHNQGESSSYCAVTLAAARGDVSARGLGARAPRVAAPVPVAWWPPTCR